MREQREKGGGAYNNKTAWQADRSRGKVIELVIKSTERQVVEGCHVFERDHSSSTERGKLNKSDECVEGEKEK